MARDPAAANDAGTAQDPFLVLVGGRIREARKRAQLKQAELAKAIGTKQSYIVGVEAGEQNLTLKSLVRISAALGVAPMTLLLEGELAAAVDSGLFDQIGDLIRTAMGDGNRLIEVLRQACALIPGQADSPNGTA